RVDGLAEDLGLAGVHVVHGPRGLAPQVRGHEVAGPARVRRGADHRDGADLLEQSQPVRGAFEDRHQPPPLAAWSAWSMSAQMSSASSIPTEIRTRSGSMPPADSASSESCWWV